jgi:hypothetical protein
MGLFRRRWLQIFVSELLLLLLVEWALVATSETTRGSPLTHRGHGLPMIGSVAISPSSQNVTIKIPQNPLASLRHSVT